MIPCLTVEQLRERLNDPAAVSDTAWVEHVERCPACLQRLEELTRGTGVLLAATPALPEFAVKPGTLDLVGADPAALLAPSTTAGDPLPAVPGYEVEAPLGRGGMGVVYRARHLRLKRTVALKLIHAGAAADPDRRHRFQVEAEAVARLQHPNIIQVFDVGTAGGQPYVALEYLPGGPLAQALAGKPQPPPAAAAHLLTLARAVDAAHQAGIVHRDLKPANVLLAQDGTLKVTDFGLAKRLEEGPGLTQPRDVLGTPEYMAPEQAAGRNADVGPAADVYALGVILYELLTGEVPFKGGTALETLGLVVHKDPVPVRQKRPQVPRDLETICLHCLHKAPARRYASAAALADDLERFRDGRPIHARPVAAAEKAWKWSRRHPGRAAALGFLGLLLLGSPAAAAWWHYAAEAAREHDRQTQAEHRRTLVGLLDQGKQAQREGNLEEAQIAWTRSLGLHPEDEGLADLRVEARQRLDDLEQSKRATAARDRAIRRARALPAGANQALADDLAELLLAQQGAVAGAGQGKATALRTLAAYVGGPVADPAALRLGLLPAELAPEREAIQAAFYALLRMAEVPTDRAREAAGLRETSALEAFDRGRALLLGSGRSASWLTDLAAAEQAFAATLARQPHFGATFLLAVCALRSTPPRPAEAVARLDACADQQRAFGHVYLARALAHDLLGQQVKPAARHWQAAERDLAEAERLAAGPGDRLLVLTNRGSCRMHQGRLTEAVADFREALRLRPDWSLAAVNLAQAYRARAWRWQAAGLTGDLLLAHAVAAAADWSAARQVLDDALALAPGRPELYRERAQLRRAHGDAAGAVADYALAIARQGLPTPTLARDLAERGRLLETHLDRPEEALAAYDQALRTDPANLDAARWRLWLLVRLKRYAGVEAACDQLLTRAVALGPEATADCYEARGATRLAKEDYDGALADWSQALALSPNRLHVRARKGWVYLLNNAARLAEKEFARVLEMRTTDGEALMGRASARVRMPQGATKAVEDVEAALRNGPQGQFDFKFKAARVFALAAYAKAAEPDRTEATILRWEKRALDLLQEAVRVCPPARQREFAGVLDKDTALKVLRQEQGAAFRAVLAAAGPGEPAAP